MSDLYSTLSEFIECKLSSNFDEFLLKYRFQIYDLKHQTEIGTLRLQID